MARHLAPFSWRQRMAEMVRRRSFGCVLPLGRHASTNGSKFVHCASDTIALSSFQKEQNARHHKQFKREQALVIGGFSDLYKAPGFVALILALDHHEHAVRNAAPEQALYLRLVGGVAQVELERLGDRFPDPCNRLAILAPAAD